MEYRVLLLGCLAMLATSHETLPARVTQRAARELASASSSRILGSTNLSWVRESEGKAIAALGEGVADAKVLKHKIIAEIGNRSYAKMVVEKIEIENREVNAPARHSALEKFNALLDSMTFNPNLTQALEVLTEVQKVDVAEIQAMQDAVDAWTTQRRFDFMGRKAKLLDTADAVEHAAEALRGVEKNVSDMPSWKIENKFWDVERTAEDGYWKMRGSLGAAGGTLEGLLGQVSGIAKRRIKERYAEAEEEAARRARLVHDTAAAQTLKLQEALNQLRRIENATETPTEKKPSLLFLTANRLSTSAIKPVQVLTFCTIVVAAGFSLVAITRFASRRSVSPPPLLG